jgi:hypothetical protein
MVHHPTPDSGRLIPKVVQDIVQTLYADLLDKLVAGHVVGYAYHHDAQILDRPRARTVQVLEKAGPMRGRDGKTNRPVPRQFTQFHQLRNANQKRELDDRRSSEREIAVLREDETAVFCAQELSVHGAWKYDRCKNPLKRFLNGKVAGILLHSVSGFGRSRYTR